MFKSLVEDLQDERRKQNNHTRNQQNFAAMGKLMLDLREKGDTDMTGIAQTVFNQGMLQNTGRPQIEVKNDGTSE